MNNTVLFRAKFILPNSKMRKFYESSNGYLRYISEKEKAFSDFKSLDENRDKKYLSYFDYMSSREGSAGYFHLNNSNKLTPIPKNSNIWDIIISLPTNFALETGMINESNWKKALVPAFKTFLDSEGFDIKNVQAIASFHSNTANPHVHIRLNELEPNHNNKYNLRKEFRVKGKFKKINQDRFKAFFRDKCKNIEIDWSLIASAKKESRTILQESMEQKLIIRNDIVNNVKEIINSRSLKRASYNSLNQTQKQAIDYEFKSFIKSFPEVNKSILKAQDKLHNSYKSYLEKSKDFGLAQNIYDEKFNEIDISLKNLFIKNILKMKSTTSLKIENKMYLRNRKQIISNQKSRLNLKIASSFLKEIDYMLIQSEREIANSIRGR